MIKVVEISNMEQMQQIYDWKYNESIHRWRTPYFYRGLPDAKFKLTTSIRRNCKELYKTLEPSILRNFTKYAIGMDPTLSQSVWKQMMVGQHHGLPTRLMDWTRSPLIAMHFANSENDFNKLDKRDCAVWRFDMHEVNRLLPEKYAQKLKDDNAFVFSVESMTAIAPTLEQYDKDMGASAFVNIEPPSVDQRIINQYSFFSIIPNGIDDVEDFLDKNTENTYKFIIRKELRWNVRDMLDQYNVSERIIYPGLDGLSRSLARHYFVKEGTAPGLASQPIITEDEEK